MKLWVYGAFTYKNWEFINYKRIISIIEQYNQEIIISVLLNSV